MRSKANQAGVNHKGKRPGSGGLLSVAGGSGCPYMNQQQLEKKLSSVTSELLREKGYICFPDVFIKLDYLTQADYEKWRRKRVPCLERVIKVNLSKINFIMRTVQRTSKNGGLKPSWTGYKSWGKGEKTWLRFSKSGKDAIEKAYATHFLAKVVKNKKNNQTQSNAEKGLVD